MVGRQGGSVITDDRHAVPDGVVSPGVCAKVVPTSAFIDVAVGANHKAEGTKMRKPLCDQLLNKLSLTIPQ